MSALAVLFRVVDAGVFALTGLLSYYLRFDDLDLPAAYQAAIFVAGGLAIVVFAAFDVYRVRPGEGMRRELLGIFSGWFGIMVGVVLLMYATKTGASFSRQWFGVWSLLALVALIAVRFVAMGVLRAIHGRGILTRRVAIAGAGTLGQEIARRLSQAPWIGLQAVAFYDDATELQGQVVEGLPVRGDLDRIRNDIRPESYHQVWIALPLRAEERVKHLLEEIAPLNVNVRFVPDIFGFRMLNSSFTEVVGLPVINVTESPLSGIKGAMKWAEDKTLAILILALIWPVMVAVAIGVRASSPGPVIYRQRRGGLDNREIVVWKFRTMTMHDEQADDELPQAKRDDPRVTKFGAFLRRTSLDELPQFINVLMGDMSIVGPRPHPLWLNEFYVDKIPTYFLRSWIKPGITGWAQICGWRGGTEETWKMEMRVAHDLFYIENWSLLFDLYIILMTVFRLRSMEAY